MKKIVAVLLCLMMLLSLFSCDSERISDNENRDDSTNTSQEDTDIPSAEKAQAEIAMEMYEAVLKNEITVYGTDTKENNYLADCRTPYDMIQIRDCENLRYAYTDLDGDSTKELVIACGDTLILRYYEGTVYLYSFTFRQLSSLNTDGSYAWNYTGQNFEHGESQIYFEGAEMKTKELYRIVNDGEPNAEYYIDGKQVTEEELLRYVYDNPKSRLGFESLEVSWQKKITSEEALQIALDYWYECYHIRPGDIDEQTGFRYAVFPKDSDNEHYLIALAWLVAGDHYSTVEMIRINSTTGEIMTPPYETGNLK